MFYVVYQQQDSWNKAFLEQGQDMCPSRNLTDTTRLVSNIPNCSETIRLVPATPLSNAKQVALRWVWGPIFVWAKFDTLSALHWSHWCCLLSFRKNPTRDEVATSCVNCAVLTVSVIEQEKDEDVLSTCQRWWRTLGFASSFISKQ